MRRSRGFALLEALVALVIVAGVGAALFALINTGLQNLAKAEAHVATTSVQPQILAWVKSADLSELPENQESSRVFQTSAGEIEARAEYQRFQGPTFAITGSGAMGIHQVALYNVRVSLYLGSRRLEDILTRRVASKQVFDEPTL
ncbi:type II secretion system protein [Marinobacter nauticus]|uniref:type II secretion system protein n=1 Tax=Marinobacter nauticus TaxID=2743 RepID=UPI00005CFA57|nr:type II secretion system protein [Marinobacter nauticus]